MPTLKYRVYLIVVISIETRIISIPGQEKWQTLPGLWIYRASALVFGTGVKDKTRAWEAKIRPPGPEPRTGIAQRPGTNNGTLQELFRYKIYVGRKRPPAVERDAYLNDRKDTYFLQQSKIRTRTT